MSEKIYYETGRSNSGSVEKHDTRRSAMRAAQKIANEYNEPVWVDARTEDDPVESWEIKPKK